MANRYLIGDFTARTKVWWHFWRRCKGASANWELLIGVAGRILRINWQGK